MKDMHAAKVKYGPEVSSPPDQRRVEVSSRCGYLHESSMTISIIMAILNTTRREETSLIISEEVKRKNAPF
jgi:hypothetical protein